MLVKSDPSSSSSTAPTTCGNCGIEERRLLHHVRHRGIFRRVCTSCVLRLHPQSFCPTCFAIYHPSPPPSGPIDAVTCFKCYSSSHTHCVGHNVPNPYICPSCVNPNSPIFTLKKMKDLGIENSVAGKGMDGNHGELRVIDKKAAKILLAAAKIAAVSMSKAAVVARAEAERRAKEAAFTRKRAREALEHVAYLVAKEKLKKKDAATATATATEVLRAAVRESHGVVVANNGNNGVGIANVGGRAMGVGVGREERRVGNVDRADGANDVLTALNAVELREGEKNGEIKGENIDVVPMDVEENGAVEVNHDGGSENERSENGDHVENHGGVGEKLSNGDVIVLPVKDQVQPVENSWSVQQNNDESRH